ncbi:MFS transporter [Bordetella bronchiseptica]|uniref:MFS transporter n=2 Tax=Bordetella bronchiseptica TaxID=518 RepID=UPI00028FEC03|nr:MFS transporter [Bordetella bronchiseptica]AUL14529.1 MFS transporter [Bordetella bronchiseptica]AWP57621.1 MFS transporter [Bordetella bronchiseptica]KAK69562.1 transporter, major facilitator family protein [Bordetella bronchiseptica MO211]KDC30852.1 transporter, major facilitator family protein [Bordetella bronchiseptica F4563]KDE00789.1 transporter, major facilitator family protein [Bordetella bronchiseptica SBL-F6116]
MPSLSAARAHRSLGWSLALLAFAQLIYSLDINIVFVALPEIGAGLGFSEQTLQWVVSAYTVFCGGFLLLGGRAVDLLGQRRMFIGALWLYALSSLVGGLAWNPAVIVIARAVQGIGAALLFPSTLSLINRLFEEGPPRNRALAIWGGAGASGLTLGSLAGGVLTSAYGWPSVFFVNVLLAGIAIVAAFLVIPKDAPRAARRSFDMPGALTATAGATLLVYALVQGPEDGWLATPIFASLALAAVFLLAFAVIESRSRDPLMPMRLFGNGSLVVGMILTFIFMGTFGALPYFLTLLFQNVQGYSALQTGLAFIVPSLAIFFGTQLGARLANRMSARSTLVAGFVTGIAGTLALASAAFVCAPYALILPGLVVSGIGQGIVWTAMWIVAASGVAHHEQGIASGMASTTLNVGNAIGIAVLVAYANRGIGGLHGDALRAGLAAGAQHAFYLAAAGLVLGLLVSLAFSPRAGAGARVGAA